MMGTVADQILKQFAGNFAAQVQARGEAGKASNTGSAAAREATFAHRAASTSATEAGAGDATNTPAKELNAVALFWAALRDWFRGLFRRRAA